jgi:uncharacterized protein YkwD
VLGLTAPLLAAETGDLERLRQRALELVNEERRNRDLHPLTLGPHLNEAAQKHAEDMLERNYYAHASPEGNTARDRYIQAGGSRWRLVAENIARCQGCETPPTENRVKELHKGWMDSPGHRENILKQGLDTFGYGIVVGADRTLYAVQTFAGSGMSQDLQAGEDGSTIDREKQNALAAQRINQVRRRENVSPLETDPALKKAASELLPEREASSESIQLGNLAQALPDNRRMEWRSLAAIAGSCGGCGTQPNAADIRSFLQQWLDDPQYRERLLDRNLTHFGLAIQANGEGLKRAVLILGQQR